MLLHIHKYIHRDYFTSAI